METNDDHRADTPEGVDLLALAQGDEELARTLIQLRTDVDQPVPNAIAAMHLRAILAESASAPSAAPARRWRRRIAGVSGLSALKLAAGAMAAAAATGGGLAATGNLPDAAQRGVATVAERIGIDLPSPADESPALDAPGRPDVPGDNRSDEGRDNGRDDEVRPSEPGRPDSPGRSADAPGQVRESERDRPETPADDRRPEEPGATADEAKPEEPGAKADEAPSSTREEPGETGSDRQPAAPGKPADAGPDETEEKGPKRP